MQIIRFMHNWSITWAKCRYEIRVWRHLRWPLIEFIDWQDRKLPYLCMLLTTAIYETVAVSLTIRALCSAFS